MADAETSNTPQLVVGETDDDLARTQNVISGDSAASTSPGPEVVPEPRAEASPAPLSSPSRQLTVSLPLRDPSWPSRTRSLSTSSTASSISASPAALTASASELQSDAAATSNAQPGSSTPQGSQSSDYETRELPPSTVIRSYESVRAPVISLQPPPGSSGRAGDAQAEVDGGSSTSSQASPSLDTEHLRVSGGLGALGLDIESTSADELEVSVPSHQEHLTSDGQRYTTYEVVVRMGGRQWSLRKRYSQFDQFRMSLRKQYKEVGLFRFPNKSKFNTFSEYTKERRRTGFDGFLRLVAVLHPRPQEVDVFLAMDEHGAGVRGRSGVTRPLAWTSGNVSPADTPGSGPALGRDWAEGGRAGLGRKLPSEWGAGRPSRGGTVHRIPRFPPLADQGRGEEAAAAAAAADAAAAASPSWMVPFEFLRQVDLVVGQVLGPELVSIICVVVVSSVSIVAVWKVGGNPGLATLVMAVGVGLLIQYWEKGLYTLGLMLEALGVGADSAQPPAPTTQRSHRPSRVDRPRAESAVAALGRARHTVSVGEGGQH